MQAILGRCLLNRMQQVFRFSHQNKVKYHSDNCNEDDGKAPSYKFAHQSVTTRVMKIVPDDFIWLGSLFNFDLSNEISEILAYHLLVDFILVSKIHNHIFVKFSVENNNCHFCMKFILCCLLSVFVFSFLNINFSLKNFSIHFLHWRFEVCH